MAEQESEQTGVVEPSDKCNDCNICNIRSNTLVDVNLHQTAALLYCCTDPKCIVNPTTIKFFNTIIV